MQNTVFECLASANLQAIDKMQRERVARDARERSVYGSSQWLLATCGTWHADSMRTEVNDIKSVLGNVKAKAPARSDCGVGLSQIWIAVPPRGGF